MFEPSVPIKAFLPKLPFYTKEILLKGIWGFCLKLNLPLGLLVLQLTSAI